MAKKKTQTKKHNNKFLYFTGIVAAIAVTCATASAFNLFNVRTSVLGWWGNGQVRTLNVPSEKHDFTGGSVITLNSTDTPTITLADHTNSAQVTVDVYEANLDFLLKYLTHDKDSNQVTKSFDPSSLNRIANFTHQPSEGDKVSLPLAEKGIYFVRATAKDTFHDAMIIRSSFGVTAKDAKSQFVFWGQSFKTKRSIAAGTIKVYNLKDQVSVVASGQFNDSGIANADLVPTADVAIAELDGDYAMVPLNMQYLNLNYNYIQYDKKPNQQQYFIFTDRPLYRPGEALHFKAILREDDDAVYTIPTGIARVRIFHNYDYENPIYDKNFPIDSGAIFGEITLPDNAPTGDYELQVNTNNEALTYYGNSTPFSIEYYKKPEYFLSVDAPQTELIQGDTLPFTVKGSFFSGQPLNKENISYTVGAAQYWDFSYYTNEAIFQDNSYRFIYSDGSKVNNGSVVLDDKGEAKVTIPTKGLNINNKNNIYSIEASLSNKSLAPAFDRKNVLVYSGEFGLYRTEYTYGTQVNQPAPIPVVLVKHISNTNVANKTLQATVKRDYWIKTQDPNQKYPTYTNGTENLPNIQATTNSDGKAQLTFNPVNPGYYTITVSTQDNRGNTVTNVFYQYIYKPGEPIYHSYSSAQNLTIAQDKELYMPSDTMRLTINSQVPDRDVLLTFNRNYVRRYQVVKLDGNSQTVDIPLQNDDIPNIYISAMSFNQDQLDRDSLDVKLNTTVKKINVKVTPERTTYGPGDTATVMVETTDYTGAPIPAETALWSVDKAIFELTDNTLGDIHNQFWSERYDNTRLDHSLEGIESEPLGGGGGCFVKGTKILMADGSSKNIEDVKTGDMILTRASTFNSELVKAPVTSLHHATEGDIVIINQTLRVTLDHIISVNNVWKPAQSITYGDELILANGQKQTVTSIEFQRSSEDVYNLEVDKYHTFFANNIWVHNQKGGGGAVRSVFKDTAYWNPRLYTDSTGRAKVSFKLPDNLTTWVIAAVSDTSDTKVGQTTSEIKVSKDIVMRPVLPNILRTGDEATVTAFVENFTDHEQKLDLNLSFDSGSVEQAAVGGQVIAPHDRKEIAWNIKPDKENKNAKLTFAAKNTQNQNLSDTIVSEIPVYNFGFAEKTAQVGDGPTTFKTNLATDLNNNKSSLTLSLAPSLLNTLPTSANYLVDYPYGCVEQTTSRFVPAIIAKSNPTLFAEALEGKDVNDMIQKGVARLESMQLSSGGWSWWYDAKPDYFVTGYVVEYLMKAKQLGIQVPDSMLNNARYFLESHDRTYYDPISQKNVPIVLTADTQILRAYALAMIQSTKEKEELTNFQGQPADLVALATLTNAFNGYTDPNRDGLNKLISMAQTQGDALYWEAGAIPRFGSKNASTALAVRAILTAKGDAAIATKGIRYLSHGRNNYYWSNTFATAQVLRTISDFSQYENNSTPNYSYTVLAEGKEISRGQVNSSGQKIKDIVIPLNQKFPSEVTIQKQGDGALYSTLIANQFHTDKNSKESTHPLRVSREYINETNPGFSLKPGDVALISLAVSGLTTDDNYAVIQDELPAGLVPVNEHLKNEQADGYSNSYYSYPFYNTDREYTENGIIITAYNVYSGTNTYSYKARVVSEGTFSAPPAMASLMYSPEIYGRSAADTVKVSKNVERVSYNHIWQELGNNLGTSKLTPQVKTAIAFGGSIIIAGLMALAIKLNWNTTKAVWNSIIKRIKRS